MFRGWFGRRPQKASPQRRRAGPALEALEDRAVPATFTVLNASDAGDGSLRAAVLAANAAAGADDVVFDTTVFSATAAPTIILTSGQLAVTDTLTVHGTGRNRLSISGGGTSRVFDVSNGAGATPYLELDNLTVTGGKADTDGGAIRAFGAGVRLNGVVVANSTAANGGGGIAMGGTSNVAGALLLANTLVYGNTATAGAGGGILLDGAFGPNVFDNSVVETNTVAAGDSRGGGIAVVSGTLALTGVTVATNRSAGEAGGLFVAGSSSLAVLNSTIDSNRSEGGAGGAGILNQGTLAVSNSTVTFNTDASTNNVGGITDTNTTVGPTIASTILYGNDYAQTPEAVLAGGAATTAGLAFTASPDLQTARPLAGQHHNYLGIGAGVKGLDGSDLVGSATADPGNPGLGSLGVFGAGSAARPLLAGSALIAKGANPLSATTDQRGTGFGRARGDGSVDIGSMQFLQNIAAPTAVLNTALDVTLATNLATYSFVVDYADPLGIQQNILNVGEVQAVGPSGAAIAVAETSVQSDGATTRVTYTFAPPGGKWTPAANGRYTVFLKPNAVYNNDGVPAAAATLGSFNVNVAGQDIGYVEALYESVLRRQADPASADAYVKRLQNGESRAVVATEIWRSDEHRRLQIADAYGGLLHRFPSAAEIDAQLPGFKNEEAFIRGVLMSEEALSKATAGTTTATLVDAWLTGSGALGRNVESYYQQFLHRTSDAPGQAYYSRQSQTAGLESVAISLLASDEFWNYFGGKY